MINKSILGIILIVSTAVYTTSGYDGGSLAPVILAGSVVKYQGSDITKKYKRKDCPVCKGTGKYLSGDGIKMVDCGYCEPETKEKPEDVHPYMGIYDKKNECKNSKCKCSDCKCKNCGCDHKSLSQIN
jgi:hypothetical protein